MKKLLAVLIVASIFSLVACGSSEEEKQKTDADATATAEELFNGLENEAEATTEEEVAEVEYADHVCNEKCTAEACFYKCGEKGHVCTEACHGGDKKGEETVENNNTEE